MKKFNNHTIAILFFAQVEETVVFSVVSCGGIVVGDTTGGCAVVSKRVGVVVTEDSVGADVVIVGNTIGGCAVISKTVGVVVTEDCVGDVVIVGDTTGGCAVVSKTVGVVVTETVSVMLSLSLEMTPRVVDPYKHQALSSQSWVGECQFPQRSSLEPRVPVRESPHNQSNQCLRY
jgi:hypothetical protein